MFFYKRFPLLKIRLRYRELFLRLRITEEYCLKLVVNLFWFWKVIIKNHLNYEYSKKKIVHVNLFKGACTLGAHK